MPAEETRSFSQFVAALEDGQLHAELTDDLKRIAEECNNHQINYGGTAKAKMSLTIEFTLEKGVFEIKASCATKLPKPPRGRSIMWTTPENRFTPQNPRQGQLFRDITDAGAAPRVV